MGTKKHPGGNRVRISDERLERLIDWGNDMVFNDGGTKADDALLKDLEQIRDDRAANRARLAAKRDERKS